MLIVIRIDVRIVAI